MIINPQIPLHRLVLSLSEALDHVHKDVFDHQRRVAYLATNIARVMGYRGTALLDVFIAGALHDIGLVGVENRLLALKVGKLETVSWHGEVGAALLGRHPMFADAAELIRHHHISWRDGEGREKDGEAVPEATHIIALADHIEQRIRRDEPVLLQTRGIVDGVRAKAGSLFHPDAVNAFCDIAVSEAFWLDVVNIRIYGVLLQQVDWPIIIIDEDTLVPIARVFARIVDAASPWTAVHSAGVAATAAALAQRMDFASRELALMKAAGYFHDIGKLTVPAEILDKQGGLDRQDRAHMRAHTYHSFRILDSIGGMAQVNEWASFHHERLDGRGYPFRHRRGDLTLGSRIMAVADVSTALAEDRPYRAGMPRQKALGILDNMATNDALDGDIVALLNRDYEDIDGQRSQQQEKYRVGQQWIADCMGSPPRPDE